MLAHQAELARALGDGSASKLVEQGRATLSELESLTKDSGNLSVGDLLDAIDSRSQELGC